MNNTELQQLMLKHRISVNELSLNTGIKHNDIKGYLTGRKTIPAGLADRIKQIGETHDRQK